MNPYRVVAEFEETIAEYAGSRYCVSTESCTAALLLSLAYRFRGVRYPANVPVGIPARTYPSVPMSIIHAGGIVQFSGEWDECVYRLAPFEITDGALRFRRGMYQGGLHCLSFHSKKQLAIGRGGAVLCDDITAMRWLKLARFDGREECALTDQKDITVLGHNCYLQAEQAARGLVLFQSMGGRDCPDLRIEDQGYPDCSRFTVFGGTP